MRSSALRLALLSIAIGGCGSSPPSPFAPPPDGGNGTLSGTVVGYADRAPIGGAIVLLGTRASVADSEGRFTFSGVPAAGAAVLTANVTGHLFRGLGLSLSQTAPGLTIDVIRDAAPFNLEFYRQFARNRYESAEPQPINPWTRAPSFYLKLLVEGTTTRVSDQVVSALRELFARSVPDLSGGKFQMAAFETGDATRPEQDGWVLVTFHPQLGAAFGRSSVGGNRGTIDIRYGMVSSPTTNPNNCVTPEIAVADHEITHTMGYWHTQNVFADTFSGAGCPGARPDHVKYHASVMYSRPPGNKDPDVDAAPSSGALAPGATARAVVSCYFPELR